MLNVRCSHSTSPEMRACSTELVKNTNRSLFVSQETFHQKVNVPGPLTVVSNVVVWLCVMMPLRPASTPSRAITGCPIHGAEPVISQIKFVASSATGNGTAGVTDKVAGWLTRFPEMFPMMTEYTPACDG